MQVLIILRGDIKEAEKIRNRTYKAYRETVKEAVEVIPISKHDWKKQDTKTLQIVPELYDFFPEELYIMFLAERRENIAVDFLSLKEKIVANLPEYDPVILLFN